jgi:hypothetical protein
MIQNFSILDREVYRSGESFYNPETLITRLSIPNFDGFKDDKLFINTFEYNATFVHERFHWLQYHGTSFGCFLGALSLSQRSTTLRMLRGESPVKIRALLNQRNKNERSILNLNHETQYPDFVADSELISMFQQIWFDHQWVHKVFEDSRSAERLGRQLPGSVVGEIIGDSMLALWEYGFPSYIECNLKSSMEARKWFSPSDSNIYFVSMFGMRLTSKNIMEAAAVISELQLLSHRISILGKSDSREALENRFQTIIDSDYGIPIRCFMRTLNIDLNSLRENLQAISVICFIALNPPLPPYVMRPPENSSSWNWQDIYPPIRFARLVNCIHQFGLLKDSSSHEKIIDYINEICIFCSLPHTLNIPYPKRAIDEEGEINFSNPEDINPDLFDSADYRKHSHNDYIFGSNPALLNIGSIHYRSWLI